VLSSFILKRIRQVIFLFGRDNKKQVAWSSQMPAVDTWNYKLSQQISEQHKKREDRRIFVPRTGKIDGGDVRKDKQSMILQSAYDVSSVRLSPILGSEHSRYYTFTAGWTTRISITTHIAAQTIPPAPPFANNSGWVSSTTSSLGYTNLPTVSPQCLPNPICRRR
jgi:hypothetical protein